MKITMCPTKLQLSKYLLGTLDESEALDIFEHIDACRTCEATIESLEGVSDTLIARLKQPLPDDRFLRESAYQRLVDTLNSQHETPTWEAGASGHPDDLPPGGQQLDEYRLTAKLGEGGMGSVYRAHHVKLHRDVALKVMSRDRMRRPDAVTRFEREMKVVGKLNHPNIVHAYDAGQVKDTHYLVMEYVEGIDLRRLVKHLGPLPISAACELVRQAALGLDHAHRHHGLVHRDIKPSNIMLTQGGRVKILDLGLALLVDQSPAEDQELTAEGQLMGTLEYMAPEQGDDSHVVDIRADIYSLGATLYKLLTGKVPFSGEKYRTPVKKMRALIHDPIPPIRKHRLEIPQPLSHIVERMLSKSPDDRFATPREVATDLETFAKSHDLAGLMRSIDLPASETVDSKLPTHAMVQPVRQALKQTEFKNPFQPERGFADANPRGQWGTIAAVLFGFSMIAGSLGFVLVSRNSQNPSQIAGQVGPPAPLSFDEDANPINKSAADVASPDASPLRDGNVEPVSASHTETFSDARDTKRTRVHDFEFFRPNDPMKSRNRLMLTNTSVRRVTGLSLGRTNQLVIAFDNQSHGFSCWRWPGLGYWVPQTGISPGLNLTMSRISVDGEFIVGIDTRQNLHLFEYQDDQWGDVTFRIKPKTRNRHVTALDYCQRTETWALGYEDGAIHLLLPSGELDLDWKWQDAGDRPITKICFCHHGTHLAASCANSRSRNTGTILFGPVSSPAPSIFSVENNSVDLANLVVGSDGVYLATLDATSRRNSVNWDFVGFYDKTPVDDQVSSIAKVQTTGFRDPFRIPAVIIDGNQLVYAGLEQGIYVQERWGEPRLLQPERNEYGSLHAGEILDLVYSPAGQFLASRDEHNNVCAWDVSSGGATNGSPEIVFHGTASMITAMALSLDGMWLAVAGSNDPNAERNEIELRKLTRHSSRNGT